MEQTEKKILQTILPILIGIVIVGYSIYPFYSMIISFSFRNINSYTIFLDFLISGIASILIGIFILKPRKTAQGKRRLGIISNIFGVVILILPIIGIISTIIETKGHPVIFGDLLTFTPFFTLFLIFGTVLIVHGVHLIRKSKKERRERKLEYIEQGEKKILIGLVSILFGAVTIVLFYIYQLFSYSFGSHLYLEVLFLGITLNLIEIFVLVPRKTRQGTMMLGINSNIFGWILVLIPLISLISVFFKFVGTSSIFIFWDSLLYFAAYIIFGIVLILHGISLLRKVQKEKEIKVIKGIVSILIGATIVLKISYPLYLEISLRLYVGVNLISPFREHFIYISVLILGIALILNGVLILSPLNTIHRKKLLGIVIILFGEVIIILSIFEVIDFIINYDSSMDVASPFPFVSIFALIGVALILRGIELIKKTQKEQIEII